MLKKIKGFYAKHPDVSAFAAVFGAFLIVFVFDMFVLNPGSVWGSATDWSCQHFAIPEYFRMRFYETHDIFPDFSFQLGAGQNIYDLSYYGIANPLYLPAYLMPWVKMSTYIQVLSIVIVLVSAVMAYYLFKKHFSGILPLALAVLFVLAGPVIYHSHRHIMFVNYFPFLFGLLFLARGRDSAKNLFLTAFFSFCMVCTSYYFSLEAFAATAVYAIYLSIEKEGRLSLPLIWKSLWRKLLFAFIGCVCAAFFWMPTIASAVSGRAKGSSNVSLWELLPSIKLDLLLYVPASPGVTCTAVIAVIALIINGSRHERFLASVIAFCAVFPAVTYFLNGMMYIDAKTLIPFIPLILLLSGDFFVRFINGEVNVKLTVILLAISGAATFLGGISFLTQKILFAADLAFSSAVLIIGAKKDIRRALIAEAVAAATVSSMVICGWDKLAKRSDMEEFYSSDLSSLVDDILDNTDDMFRFAEENGQLMTVNRIYRTDYLTTNIYSSLSNKHFRDFRLYSSGSDVDTRNNAIQVQPLNIVFNTLTGCRYRITTGGGAMYSETEKSSRGKYTIYENKNALPLGYASADVMCESDYLDLPWERRYEAILGSIIVPDCNAAPSAEGREIPVKLDFESAASNDGISITDGIITVKSKKPITFELDLDEPVRHDILMIKCAADNRFGKLKKQKDIIMTINGIQNKLTAPTWKYHNGNYAFNYIVSSAEDITSLEIVFSPGNYTISALEAYLLDASVLDDVMSNKDEFVIKHSRVIGDSISGSVDVSKDGWFNISIPYDKNFRINVDGNDTDFVMTNTAFIGFPITAGRHEITITYLAPMKREGLAVSLCGISVLALLLVITAVSQRRKKEEMQ